MRCRFIEIAALIVASTTSMVVATALSGQDWQDDQAGVVQSFGEHRGGPMSVRLRHTTSVATDPRRFDRDEAELDFSIQQVSERLAAVEHETDQPPPADDAIFSLGDLTPSSFRLMGYLSVALALFGLTVVVRNRPEFAGLRGKNESRDARRTVVRCVVALVVLNLADLAFTSLLVPTRSFVELNPLADSLLGSLPALIFVKIALVAGGTLLLLTLWRHKIAQLASWGTAVTYVFAAMWWVMYFHTAMS
jgi:hypothetical protein